jgi:hypothetical protein
MQHDRLEAYPTLNTRLNDEEIVIDHCWLVCAATGASVAGETA